MSAIFGKNKAAPNYDEGTLKLWSVSELQQFIGVSANRGGAFALANCVRNGVFEPPNAAAIIRAQQLMLEKKSGVLDTFGAFESLSSKGISVSYEAERILLMPEDGKEIVIRNSPVPTQQKVNKQLYETTAILLVSLSKLSKGRIEELFSVAKWEAVLSDGQKEVSIAGMTTVVNMFRHIFENLPIGAALAEAKKTLTGASYTSLVIDVLSVMPMKDYDALQTTICTELYDVFEQVDGKWKVKTKRDATTGEVTPIVPVKTCFTKKSTGAFVEEHGLEALYCKGVPVRVPAYKNITFDNFVKKRQQFDDVCGSAGTGANTFLSGFGFAGYPTASMRQVLRKIAMVRGAEKYLSTYEQWKDDPDTELYRKDDDGEYVMLNGKQVLRTEEDLRSDYSDNVEDCVVINVEGAEVGLMTAALLDVRVKFLVTEAVMADPNLPDAKCVDVRDDRDVNLYYFSTAWPTLPSSKAKLATTTDYTDRVLGTVCNNRVIVYMPILCSVPWDRKFFVSTHGNYSHLEGYISFSSDFSLVGEEKGKMVPSEMVRHETFAGLLDKANALMGALIKWIFKPTKVFYDPISNGLKRDLSTTKVMFDSDGELLSSTVLWTPSEAVPEILEQVHASMVMDAEMDVLVEGEEKQVNFSKKKPHPEKVEKPGIVDQKQKKISEKYAEKEKEYIKAKNDKKLPVKVNPVPEKSAPIDDDLDELGEADDAEELN